MAILGMIVSIVLGIIVRRTIRARNAEMTEKIRNEQLKEVSEISKKKESKRTHTPSPEDYVGVIAEGIGISNPESIENIIKAYLEPYDFVSNNRYVFNDYFLSDTEKNDNHDISLITLLYYGFKKKVMWGLDWNTSNDDVVEIVNTMLLNIGSRKLVVGKDIPSAWLDYNSNEYKDINDLFVEINKLVKEQNLALFELGRGNDAYEIFFVKTKILPKFKFACKKMGYYCKGFE